MKHGSRRQRTIHELKLRPCPVDFRCALDAHTIQSGNLSALHPAERFHSKLNFLMNRRSFLASTSAFAISSSLARAASRETLHLATNTYPWSTFAGRGGKAFTLHSDEALADIAATGLQGYEPLIKNAAEFDGLPERLKAHGLEMRSIYVNSTLHEAEQAKASIMEVLSIARRAVAAGVKIVVTNPSPIQWGGSGNKTDAQLLTQSSALNQLAAELSKLGLTLAYHNHDSELREGAREFHHMLTATDPALVKFCLDAHWLFRGCGDSQVALFDAVEHYGSRIVELHLRQSEKGTWTEVFSTAGDIDYARLADWLHTRQMRPHLVLEQAVEKATPNTLDAVEAHRRGRAHAEERFAVFATDKLKQ